MPLILSLLIAWLTLLLALLQYGPRVVSLFKALVDAIREKNAEKGAAAVTDAAVLAEKIVMELRYREDLSNDAKREQAWQDLQAGMAAVGVTLSETNARSLVQLAYQKLSGK